MLTLKDAERSAGVHTRAIRGSDSSIIDICIIDTSDKNCTYNMELVERIRKATGSKPQFLDTSYGGTLVALSFEEAHLTWKVFRSLKRNGHPPSYRRKMRYSLRCVRLRA
jgi:hypothetical protein